MYTTWTKLLGVVVSAGRHHPMKYLLLLCLAAKAAQLPPSCPAAECSCVVNSDPSLSQLQHQQRITMTVTCMRSPDARVPRFRASTLPVSEIKLSNCDLTRVSANAFASLTRAPLVSIQLNDNKIEHIDNGAFTGIDAALTELDLSHNHLADVSFLRGYSFRSLRLLSLADNRLTAVDGTSLGLAAPALQELTLSENNLVDADFLLQAQLHNLELLILSNNAMRRFSASALRAAPRLKVLYVAHNHLSDAEFLSRGGNGSESYPIQTLMLSENKLKTIDGTALAIFQRLETLDLADNLLESADFLRVAAARGGLQALETLLISGNKLSTLGSCVLAPLGALKEVNYDRNPITCTCADEAWLRDAVTTGSLTINHEHCQGAPSPAGCHDSKDQPPIACPRLGNVTTAVSGTQALANRACSSMSGNSQWYATATSLLTSTIAALTCTLHV